MKKSFWVVGLRPAFGKQVNDLIKAFDLGTDGAFVKFFVKATVTLKDNDKPLQEVIKAAYEKAGCVSVKIAPATNEEVQLESLVN